MLASFLVIFAAQAIAGPPEVAEILEPAVDAKPLDPEDVHMVAEFSDGDGDEHVCTDWEIWTVPPEPVEEPLEEPVWRAPCVEGSIAVHIHLGDGEFINSHEGRLSLLPESSYELRVRFKDDSDPAGEEEWSEWETRRFTTREPGPVGSDSKTWEAREGYVVETFAEDLQLPTNIAMVPDPGHHPDDPFMYVTELYGNVKVITRDGAVSDYATELLNFDPLGNFPGAGEKGLTGIVVDPESGDVFVSMIYDDEGVHRPKVVRLISAEDGMSKIAQEDVLYMDETRQGPSHQISNLTISPDGNLFVHNADGGQEKQAPEIDSFLGKVLRMKLDGDPLADNPFYTDDGADTAEDYVWAKGLRNPFGGAWRLSDETHWMVENGPGIDRLAKVDRGEDYHWPADPTMSHRASYNWDPAHAPVNIEFVEEQRFGGSGFPDVSLGHAFVTESGPTWGTGPEDWGKRVVEFDLGPSGELVRGPITLVEYVGTGKATAVGLAAGDDGLYFTDLYKDKDFESPVDRGANVLRIRCTGHCPLPGEQPPPTTVEPPVKPVVDPAPSIEGFDVRPKAFAVGLGPRLRTLRSSRARSSAVGRGTTFFYGLSERSRVWIGIRPLMAGWRLRGHSDCRLFSQRTRKRLSSRVGLRRCVLPERRGVRQAGRCRPGSWHRGDGRLERARCVLRGPRGVIRGPGEPGNNMRPYAGKLGNRWLRPGRYLGVVRARDLDDNHAQPRHTTFRVVSRRAR